MTPGWIAQRFTRAIDSPMTALFVQTEGNVHRSQSMAVIEASLTEMDGRDEVRRLVVRASDVVDGILRRADSDCLIVLGFSEEDSLDTGLFGHIPQRLLSGAPGPLLLVKQAVSESVPDRVRHRLSNLLPTLTPAEEAEVVQVAYDLARPTTNFFVLVVLSCLIASLALLMNNVGVVIGAMLIAPLMSPLMAFAVGLIEGRPDLMRTAALTLLRGVLMAFLLAVTIGLLSPLRIPTSEMLARGQPLLPDMGIALFSGMAGAYAMARKDIASALAGVAIAAALMPPLCTVGLGVAFGLLPLASGAFLLFLTNIVSITLGGGLVFLWMGLRLRARTDRPNRYRWRVATSIGVLVLLALPLAATFRSSIQQSTRLEALRQVLEAQFDGDVVSVELPDRTFSGSEPLHVVATMHLPEAPTQEALALAQAEAARQLGQPVDLELVIWLVIGPTMPEPADD
jgi:uncharacterized hydrophobic protein (TIGR00271 family)